MAELALAALYRAIRTALSGTGELWAGRAYMVYAPDGAVRPYVVFYRSAGGEANERYTRDANIMIDVMCVADSITAALAVQGRVHELLNDKGVNDRPVAALNAGSEWQILSTTAGQQWDGAEVQANGQRLFFVTTEYDIWMGVISNG